MTLLPYFINSLRMLIRGCEVHTNATKIEPPGNLMIPQYKLSSFKKEYEMFKVYKWKTIDENR